MRRATLKGWRYAMDNPEEIIDVILTKYQVDKTREHLEFEATEIRKLIVPELIQIGHMNPDRWQHMRDTFIKANLIDDGRYFDGFIYDTSTTKIPYWVFPTLSFAFVIVLITTLIIIYLQRFNRKLAENKQTLQESEARFKALSEATYGGLMIHDQGRILECNYGLSEITGFDYSELIGMNGLELILPEDLEIVLQNMRDDYTHSYEVTGVRKDGSTYALAIKGKNIVYKGRNARVVEFVDITNKKQIEDKLKLAASVFTHAREGIMITDPNGNIIDVNDTFCHITGYSRDESLGQNPRFLNSGRHSQAFFKAMWASLIEDKQWSGEIWNKRKSGELYVGLITISAVTDKQEKTKNYVALFSDITRMKQHQQQLERIAHYDTLTNLPNRVMLADRLKRAMTQSVRRQQFLAVAYLDLDGFKMVNDTYGHNMGDQLLIELSKYMSDSLREGDTIARIGGDEFIVLLVDLDSMDDCERVLDRLLQAATRPVTSGSITAQVSTSIGVTLFPQDDVSADQLIRHADQAMYIAKQTGKNHYHFFDIHQDKSIQSQHVIIEHIQQGLEQGEFFLHYQPKVNMRTGEVVGVEALIRWQHPERGLLLPSDFLPMIENHPISLVVGDWVIATALSQMATWQKLGLVMPVSVNVDAFQLQQEDFIAKLSIALAHHPKIKPSLLELEILETSALGDIMKVMATMEACIGLGVNFALDDFGTGFSSLTYLKRLPAHLLKIDQSFVRDMLVDIEDRSIVMGVISLAKAFNRQVIAEGVETIAHGSQLLAMGCELAQGYGIAMPMHADKLPTWLAQWQPDPAWDHV
ncbi:EAL domain-containing protein [Shewanella aestuarii]|uniref:EAL domain-containing protein n=2 Tax=Shewanella aestuarii TaxID=1028752 RepID=A0A6G9QQ63_9GAMM|nr:EAL domain-containing protein [Shewanella aestuarii]